MAPTIPVPEGREGELRPLNRWLRELAARTPMPRYMAAMARLQRGVRSLMEETQHFDALLCPTLALLPGPVGTLTAEGPEAEFRLMTEFAPFTSLFNVTGQPSLSIPLHRTGTGLPIGAMLTGRPGEEGTLLSLSAQLEEARPWAHRSRPAEHGQGAFRDLSPGPCVPAPRALRPSSAMEPLPGAATRRVTNAPTLTTSEAP